MCRAENKQADELPRLLVLITLDLVLLGGRISPEQGGGGLQENLTRLIRQILAAADLQAPDGRPLHAYPMTSGQSEALRRAVRTRFLEGNQELAAAAFVFWAAEDFRARFPDGERRRWDFLFAGLDAPRPDDATLDSVVNVGLGWWKRDVRRSAAGHRMRVYTLMAEGGLPQKLLAQEGLYRRVVLGRSERSKPNERFTHQHWRIGSLGTGSRPSPRRFETRILPRCSRNSVARWAG